MKKHIEPQIISQHVDTLKTSHKSADYKSYCKLCTTLDKLYLLKQDAQQIESTNQSSRFVVTDLYKLGRFKVYAQGAGVYQYKIENDDFNVLLGNIEHGSDRPQIVVKYFQKFLVSNNHLKAYEIVCNFIKSVMGNSIDLVTEIHLATDIWGISYDADDTKRFQTNFKVKTYSRDYPFMDGLEIKTAGRTHLETISIGKDEFMFRIYDKEAELSKKPADKLVTHYLWIMHGFKPDLNIPVWRHEIQLRGSQLKLRLPRNSTNQVLDTFNMLGNLWAYAMSKISYTPLNDDEIKRISEADKQDTIKKIFKRAKEQDRENLFDYIQEWRNNKHDIALAYSVIQEANMQNAIKAALVFVTLSYKVLEPKYDSIAYTLEQASKYVYDKYGMTLDEYASSKVVDSYLKLDSIAQNQNIIPNGYISSYDNTVSAYMNILRYLRDGQKSPLVNISRFEKLKLEREYAKRGLSLPSVGLGSDGISNEVDSNASDINRNNQDDNSNYDEIPF